MYCMVFTLEGNAKIVLKNGREFKLHKNSVFFGCNSNINYMESNCEHWHQLAYWFAILNIDLPVNNVYPLNELDASKENRYIDKLILLMQTHQKNNLNYVNALCSEKLFETLRKINYSNYMHNERLDKILSYINTNIEKNLTLKDIAEEFHYCEKHLNHIFQSTAFAAQKIYQRHKIGQRVLPPFDDLVDFAGTCRKIFVCFRKPFGKPF